MHAEENEKKYVYIFERGWLERNENNINEKRDYMTSTKAVQTGIGTKAGRA